MTTQQMSIAPEDLALLWQINPLAQAQLQAIVKERLLVDAQNRISNLEAQLDEKNKSPNGKVKQVAEA